ncbi:type II secretion system F family protein [Oceanirhabdus sp. W0125-5]|uniref:type II secretion system F family protein n=1 Tax=Oceanirhabdus sp. W0125-5 TaxID=2999116 RepID=UPI0022F2BAD8|nr:type II secretion system F family protein [Oceanirhabdus sp. W0125-5]WBW95539.1 type II secretion system F family protein [Oceanirhabdus sp. W0125-5]
MLVSFFLLTVTLFLFYIVLKIFEPRFKTQKRIDEFVNTEKVIIKREEENEPLSQRIILRLRIKTKGYFGEKISSKKEQVLDKKLLQAGNPFGMSPIEFHALKITLNLLLPVLFGMYGKLLKFSINGVIILGVIGFIFSIIIPTYYVNQKIRQRYKEALKELPDFLDILTVCLEAGLGFDGALNKVISKKVGVLPSEFHICLEEMRLGKTRKEALSGVKERLEFDEIKSLINNILQAEKLGISIVKILRIKSQEEREKRKQRAEEEAMKAPIKILFPLVLFIFPSIFIVLLGPAVIQLINEFMK